VLPPRVSLLSPTFSHTLSESGMKSALGLASIPAAFAAQLPRECQLTSNANQAQPGSPSAKLHEPAGALQLAEALCSRIPWRFDRNSRNQQQWLQTIKRE